jgi:hypothetical protein
MKAEKLEIKTKLIKTISAITKFDSDNKLEKAIKKVAENLSEIIIEDRKKAKKKAEKKAKKEQKKASKAEKIKPNKIIQQNINNSKGNKPNNVVN